MSDQTNGHSSDEQHVRPFNPTEHVVQLKTKEGFREYLPVQWRLVWFRSLCPQGIIETEMLQLDLDRETEEEVDVWSDEKNRYEKATKSANGFVVFRAVVKDGKGGVGTGTKSEKAASFADYIEKAETGAIGRALAALGFGTQFAPELDEEHRIVDSPIKRGVGERNGSPYNASSDGRQKGVVSGNKTTGNGYQTPVGESTPAVAATEKQLISIRKLCEYLGRAEPEKPASMSYMKAKELIDQLTLEYKQSRVGSA